MGKLDLFILLPTEYFVDDVIKLLNQTLVVPTDLLEIVKWMGY